MSVTEVWHFALAAFTWFIYRPDEKCGASYDTKGTKGFPVKTYGPIIAVFLLCVCVQTITFQQSDLWHWYLMWWFILTLSGLISQVKVIGQTSRSRRKVGRKWNWNWEKKFHFSGWEADLNWKLLLIFSILLSIACSRLCKLRTFQVCVLLLFTLALPFSCCKDMLKHVNFDWYCGTFVIFQCTRYRDTDTDIYWNSCGLKAE